MITDLSPPLTSEIEAFPSDERIMPSMLEQTHIDQPRIVLPARTMPDPNIFDAKLAAMHVNVVDWLYEQEVSFVRIEHPVSTPQTARRLMPCSLSITLGDKYRMSKTGQKDTQIDPNDGQAFSSN